MTNEQRARLARLSATAFAIVVLDEGVDVAFTEALLARDEEALVALIRANSELDAADTEDEIATALAG